MPGNSRGCAYSSGVIWFRIRLCSRIRDSCLLESAVSDKTGITNSTAEAQVRADHALGPLGSGRGGARRGEAREAETEGCQGQGWEHKSKREAEGAPETQPRASQQSGGIGGGELWTLAGVPKGLSPEGRGERGKPLHPMVMLCQLYV